LDKKKFALDSLNESSETKLKMKDLCLEPILSAVDLIAGIYKKGNKLLLCGNGGSAADCQHIATEFMIRLNHKIKRPPLCAIALTTDSSNLTACGNDIGFENVFTRSVEGLGNKGDVLIAISTSGNSPNIIKAVEMAHKKGMKVVGFLGDNGGKLKTYVDLSIIIPSANVQRIQEGHITLAHILCELVELELFGNQLK
jgi:D-sedoheptulose 7-phosphate isomerase